MFFDDLAGKCKRIRSGEDISRAPQTKPCRSNYVIESSNLGTNVVGTVAGFDVFVIGTAVEDHVALDFRIPGGRVVGDFIGIEHVVAIVDFGLAAQLVERAIFFLLNGVNGDFFFRQICGIDRDRRGHCLRGGKGLAGYYPGDEKEMTKRKGRDNDSVAEDHCRSTFAPPAVANGSLTLACGWYGKQSSAD